MSKIILNDALIRALEAPARGQIDVWDASVRGFGIRVSQGGSKTFILNQGGVRRTLGRFGDVSLAQARHEARTRRAERFLHHHTVNIRHQAAVDEFLASHVRRKNKASTAREYERQLRRYFCYTGAIQNVSQRQVLASLQPLKPGEQNHAFAVARAFFNWAVRRNYLSKSPLFGLPLPNPPRARERLLTDGELKVIWQESHEHGSFGALVRLLILTGQRLGQITSLRADWMALDPSVIAFPAPVMKSNAEQIIPLTRRAKSMLPAVNPHGFYFPAPSGDKPFTSYSSAMRRFREDLERRTEPDIIPHWTLHDFRRYFSSTMAKLRTPIHVTERLLAHTTGSMTPIARVYNRHTYIDEMREALNRYERHLFRTVLKP